jgi:hydrogenase nickel incorporation protein HypB
MAEGTREHVDVTVAAELSIGRPPPAALIRRALAQSRVLGIRIIGHPGSGKTELIEATLKRLVAPRRVAVIVVNPASGRDAERLQKYCGHVAQIDAATPDAATIWRAMGELRLEDFDTLLIEAAGGLADLHDLGQDATVAVFAVSGGDDKAAEYHALLKSASAILLTKIDLRPLVKFDGQVFRNDIRAVNSSAEIHETSAMTGSGLIDWLDWMDRTRATKTQSRLRGDPHESPSDEFIG